MCCIRFAAQFFINNNISFVTHWITERYTWISSLMALSMPIFYIPLLPQCLWSWTIAQWLCMIQNSKYSLFIIYRTLLYYSLVLFDYDKNQSKYYFNKYWNFNFNKKKQENFFFFLATLRDVCSGRWTTKGPGRSELENLKELVWMVFMETELESQQQTNTSVEHYLKLQLMSFLEIHLKCLLLQDRFWWSNLLFMSHG